MLCYDCALQQRDAPAIGICVRCGKGLCREHVRRQETRPLKRIAAGMGERIVPSAHATLRLLCADCLAAGGGEEEE